MQLNLKYQYQKHIMNDQSNTADIKQLKQKAEKPALSEEEALLEGMEGIELIDITKGYA